MVVVVHLDYNVSSGPFLSFDIEIGDGPGPELDNCLMQTQIWSKYQFVRLYRSIRCLNLEHEGGQ